MIQAVFRDRDLITDYTQPDLVYKVRRYSWNVIGGPKQAVIDAFGPDVELWRLIEMIRNGVWIYDRYGEERWWGYVAEVRLTVKSEESLRNPTIQQRVQVGITVDSFFNRIQVIYTELDPPNDDAGAREDTAWADDDDSQDEYGIKELMWTKDDATQAFAEQARDMKLEQVKYPVPVISFSDAQVSRATIICRGLWDTLGWQYYENLGASSSVATSTQIETILDAEGQFFLDTDLEVASGIDTSDFRDGDGTALFEVVQLLEMGTDNFLRMLATVEPNRRVSITEEASPNDAPYTIDANGSWYDEYGTEVRRETCPVGVWARMKTVFPPSVDSSAIADPSKFFVEENEYDVVNNKLNHIARGAPDPWEFPTVRDG